MQAFKNTFPWAVCFTVKKENVCDYKTRSHLQAEKKVLEASLEDSIFKPDRAGLVASTPLLQAGREATQVEARYCFCQL